MDMPTQHYGTSNQVSFQDGSRTGGPEPSPGADPHHQDAQQQDVQQQQIPSYSSMFVKEMQQQVNALLDNEVLSMTREIDSTIQATANCMGQVKVPHDALQARHDSIKLFQETMAQLDTLADMVRDFQGQFTMNYEQRPSPEVPHNGQQQHVEDALQQLSPSSQQDNPG